MMNDAEARRDAGGEPIVLRQNTEITADQVRTMVAEHYAAKGLAFHPSHVVLNVHDSAVGLGSTRDAGFDGATIRLPRTLAERAEAEGMPSVLELKPAAVAAIVAGRVGPAIGCDLSAGSVDWKVMGSGGNGFNGHLVHLTGAAVRTTVRA